MTTFLNFSLKVSVSQHILETKNVKDVWEYVTILFLT